MRICAPLPLEDHLNARAATFDHDRCAGAANPWGNSFPAEELPFGATVRVGGVDFRMPRADGANDHVELRGQELALPPVVIVGIAALGYGEMGPRPWAFSVGEPGISPCWVEVAIPGWLALEEDLEGKAQLACSHLHYPGGYELDCFRPAAWAMIAELPALRASRLRLSRSPLVHLFALTLLVGGAA